MIMLTKMTLSMPSTISKTTSTKKLIKLSEVNKNSIFIAYNFEQIFFTIAGPSYTNPVQT